MLMKNTLMLISMFLILSNLFSQEEVKLKDGKTIIVYSNGTWKYKTDIPTGNTFTDSRDGHVYKTVTIGSQIWMAENLAFKASSGCWAYSNDQNNVSTYGYLYNWETAKMVCPAGWHLPSDDEWSTLTNYLGFEISGGKLKETGTTHWESPNTGANNETGFTALPGGRRDDPDKSFTGIGSVGVWWTSTECPGDEREKEKQAWHRLVMSVLSNVYRDWSVQSTGYSVRCVKD